MTPGHSMHTRSLVLAVASGVLAACGSATTTPTHGDAATTPLDAVPLDTAVVADTAMTDVPMVTLADGFGATDSGPVVDVPQAPIVASPCSVLTAGDVTSFMVDGTPREVIVTLPTGATGPGGHWPVVFSWHGLGDTASNFNGLLAGSADNATMPFILVTPESLHLLPNTTPIGLEWDEIQVEGSNVDARMYDAVLACVTANWGVDPDRVYSVGFSAGAIMSDVLGTLRGDQLASIVSYSGAYFADPADPPTLGLLASVLQYPGYHTGNRYPQMFLYGGTSDVFSLVVAEAHFDEFAMNDSAWLNGMGHDAIVCDHGLGHTVPPGVQGPQLVEFMNSHPRGTVHSPWSTGLPSDYPSYCTFQGQTGTM